MKKLFILSAAALLLLSPSFGQRKKNQEPAETKKTIASFTANMQKSEGYFNFYWDDKTGKIFLEVDKWDTDFLYVNALAAGVGSNDIGLDRGQLGGDRIVAFQKHGPKVLLIQPNQGYRAVSDNPDEVRSVQEAFASSALGGFKIEIDEGAIALIDITSFLLRDSHQVANRLKRTGQGSYSIDAARSTIYMPATMNFPENSEFEAILTFKGTPQDYWISSVTPTADAVTVRTHHSFIKLPDDQYEPRAFDPRGGFGSISYQDYATPIDEPLVKRFIRRHRLVKKDPSAAISEPVEPIIYYLDRGAPEPVKSALLEGAAWWNQAFEAAGFRDAFQVQVLPEGAHPLDVRYNVIQWVHRSTRGWSYGSSVDDPRTGEIIKGHVSLGSLRVRQDFLIATGLLQPYENGDESSQEMVDMALARLRQLSAHEVGHTIGLSHNFASSYNDRASVMDYPHPLVSLDDEGNIDLSNAYDVNIGEWDKVAIRYGYGYDDNPSAVLDEAFEDGLLYITDRDSRPMGGAHPVAHLWDNGASAADELNRMMDIRRKVLDNFSEASIKNGVPLASIEEALVPMYLFHRYQVDGTSKVVGGVNYSYATRGDGQVPTEMIDPGVQEAAIDALVSTLSPDALRLPDELLAKIPPKPPGYSRGRENFVSKTGPAFDYFAAIETAATLPMSFLLHPHRANRLEMYQSLDSDQPGLQTVINKITAATWESPSSNAKDRAIQKIVEKETLDHLIALHANDQSYPQVKALAGMALRNISGIAKRRQSSDAAYYLHVQDIIDQYLDDPGEYEQQRSIKAPDGSPIGTDHDFLNFCSYGY